MSYSLACVIVRETTDAVLIRDVRDDREHWIPFSQIETITRGVPAHTALGQLLDTIHLAPGVRCTAHVVMTEFIAQARGLP